MSRFRSGLMTKGYRSYSILILLGVRFGPVTMWSLSGLVLKGNVVQAAVIRMMCRFGPFLAGIEFRSYTILLLQDVRYVSGPVKMGCWSYSAQILLFRFGPVTMCCRFGPVLVEVGSRCCSGVMGIRSPVIHRRCQCGDGFRVRSGGVGLGSPGPVVSHVTVGSLR